MTLRISSSAFEDRETIPQEYTCDGKDISPPLAWSGAPTGTVSFALIVDDPDAPVGVWDHWIVFDIPPDVTGLPAAVPAGDTLPGGGVQGSNSWRRTSYGGPCPPSGTHRYLFKLYALDTTLGLKPGANKKAVETAMQDHMLASAQLIGTYKRS